MFRLPDLYLKTRRYDDALKIVNKIKGDRNHDYFYKAESYILKIENLQTRASRKK